MTGKHTLQTLITVLAGLLWAVVAALPSSARPGDGVEVPWWMFWSQNTSLDGQRVPWGAVVYAYAPADLPEDCPVGHNLWVDFLGQASTLDSQPFPVGAVVRAYDTMGMLVGCSEVGVSGWYLMAVYGDDVTTSERDGVKEGDTIAFTVNGHQAVPLGPDPPVWTPEPPGGDGRVDVELQACTLPGDFDCNCRVDVADIQSVARQWGIAPGQQGYYPPYDADGDGIDAGDIQQVALDWRNSCL